MPDSDATTLGPTLRPDGHANSPAGPASSGVPAVATPSIPSSIGRYRIPRLLGMGGMGAVYEAEQDRPHRTVALKVIRAGYADSEMLRRFENETQALGRLQHAGIAQIFDAGTAETPFGKQPYIAMELVQGQTLLVYCDGRRLTAQRLLELMTKICDAVEHAHQRGLIHRDLKPTNILVGEDGQPKILDFGVARLTDSDAQATQQTGIGELIGTLAYMSPEQVLGDSHEIDTRTDVYTLGVILYEMLARKAPYEIGRQLHEAVRAIREAEPSSLSTVNRAYRGDIETIVSKALEKDKARRYASAAEMAADIRRHLNDEPIVAKPPTTTYQLRKFVRRNKALVSGVAAVFVALVLGIVASTREAVLARRSQRMAQQESAIAQAVNDFLQHDLLGQASAYNQSKPDPNVTVHTVLDRAAANIQGKFRGQPQVEAAIRETIGTTYGDLGLYAEETQQLRQAAERSRTALGPENPRTLQLMDELAMALAEGGNPTEAERIEQETLSTDRRVLGGHDRQTLHVMSNLAHSLHLENRYKAAAALDLQTLELERRYLGERDRLTVSTLNNLEAVYLDAGDYTNASAIGPLVVELSRAVYGPDHPNTISAVSNLASADLENGKYEEAESLYRQVVESDRRILGTDHPQTLLAMDNLGGAYVMHGKYSEAQTLLERTLDGYRKVLGSGHSQTVFAMLDLGDCYDEEGQFRKANGVYREALELSRAPSSLSHGQLNSAMTNVAWSDYQLGNYAEAESLDKELLADEHRNPGEDIANTLVTQENLASAYLAEGRTAEAGGLYRQTLAAMQRALRPGSPYILETHGHLAEAERREGRYREEAEDAMQAWTGRQKLAGADSPGTLQAENDLVLAYLSAYSFAKAEPLARAAFDAEGKVQPRSWQRFWAESLLGESLAGEKQITEATPLLGEGYRGMLAARGQIAAPDQYRLMLAHHWLTDAER